MNTNNRDELKQLVINHCNQELSNKIQKRINYGMNPLDAYDQVLEKFKFEEEIILAFEFEAEKVGLNQNLELEKSEIKFIENKLKNYLLNKFLKQI